jgi:hypothetical protein
MYLPVVAVVMIHAQGSESTKNVVLGSWWLFGVIDSAIAVE